MSHIRTISFIPCRGEGLNQTEFYLGENITGYVNSDDTPWTVGRIQVIHGESGPPVVNVESECRTRCIDYPNAVILAIEWCDLDPEETS